MAPRAGDSVRVHYRGTLTDGTQFDSSEGREPLEFTVGAGDVIPGFDAAVAKLEVGEKATVTIPAAEAYGDHDEAGVQAFPIDQFPPGSNPQAGWTVELSTPDGMPVAAVIMDVTDETVVLDFNHPLAGQDLTFELELVSIEPSSETAE